eukprot:EG_transcript_21307
MLSHSTLSHFKFFEAERMPKLQKGTSFRDRNHFVRHLPSAGVKKLQFQFPRLGKIADETLIIQKHTDGKQNHIHVLTNLFVISVHLVAFLALFKKIKQWVSPTSLVLSAMAGEHVRDAPAVAPGKGSSAGKEVGQIFRDYGWGPVQWQYSWSPEGLSECRLELPNEADEDLRERIACIVGMGLDQSQSSRAAAELVLPLLPQPLPRLPLGTVFCPPEVCIVRSTEQAGEM